MVSRGGRLRQSVFHFNDNLFPDLLANRTAEGDKGETGQDNNCRELHWNPLSQRFTAKQESERAICNQVQATQVGVTNRGNARDLLASRPERNTVSAATSVRGWARITESPSFCCSDLWMSRTLFLTGLEEIN